MAHPRPVLRPSREENAMTPTVQPESKPPSRRALLAGALGGIGTLAATAIGRASPVQAEGENIQIGLEYDTATSLTRLTNITNGANVFQATSTAEGIGVYGSSNSYVGVYGSSSSSVGVYGYSNSSNGVYGNSSSASQAATVGASQGHNTGVQGYSGVGILPAAKAKTGVFGYANQDTTATGVRGESVIGVGVRGKATTGYAGFFDGRVFTTRYYELAEIATPNAPAANQARLFVRDNGAGKTQLCVRYNTGAVQVLNTQP
jgi:hypothetical protein